MPIINLKEETPNENIEEEVRKNTKKALEESQESNDDEGIVEEEVVSEEEEVVTAPVKEAPEDKASKKGWVPLDQYVGDPEEWVDAKEFLARGPLYETIHKLNRKVKKMEETVEAAKDQYSKAEQRGRAEALAELKGQLKQASEDRDIEKALEVKDKIVELETEEKSEASKVVNPDFDEWVADNTWYDEGSEDFDEDLHSAATAIGYRIARQNKQLSSKEIYAEVTKRIKKKFPESFSKETKMTTAVTPTTRRVTSNKTNKSKLPSYKHLPEDSRINYRRLVKSDRNPNGILTHDQFMKDYIAAGGTLETEE